MSYCIKDIEILPETLQITDRTINIDACIYCTKLLLTSSARHQATQNHQPINQLCGKSKPSAMSSSMLEI